MTTSSSSENLIDLPDRLNEDAMEELIRAMEADTYRAACVDSSNQATLDVWKASRLGFFKNGRLMVSYIKRGDGLWRRAA